MKKFFYRVQPQDSVTFISQKFNIPCALIINANNLSCEVESGDLLYLEQTENQKIYRVGLFDTLESLAEKFNTTPRKILLDNGTPYIYFSQIILV